MRTAKRDEVQALDPTRGAAGPREGRSLRARSNRNRRWAHWAVVVGAGLFGLLAAGDDARAQKAKKPKKAKLQATSETGPQLKYEQFRRSVEVQVAEKREAQIDGLKRLLDLNPEESEIPDIKFRLAELYFEKSQFYFFRAQEADDRMLKAKDKGDKGAAHAAEGEKKKHAIESQGWANQAVDIYKDIRERYPNYKRMPEVLFALGQSYWNAGRLDDAIEVYSDLIKNFKDSPLVADAWLAFGEYYFNKADLNRALKSYELAAADKRSRVYGFALYKQGWCYYNLADWSAALSKFRAVIYYSYTADVLGGERKISLAREAQKDFVRTYAHQGDARKAKFVLADIAAGDTPDEKCTTANCLKLLEQLGDIWFAQGSFDEAAIIYRDLMQARPDSSRNPYYQGKIVDLVSRGGDKNRTTIEARRLVEEYQRVELQVKEGKGDPQAKANLEEAQVLAESTLRRLAQLWNKEAKKTRQKKTYEHARDMYEDYLRLFTSSKFGYELRFQLGDLYYKLEQFDKAAKAYEETVLADPKGKYLIDAANDNILAIEENLKDLGLGKVKVPKGKELEAIEIHPERKRLMDACDRYVKFVPADKADKLVSVQYKVALLMYEHNHFDEAITRFEDMVVKYPGAEETSYAANLVVDVHNLREDWQKLYDTAVAYLKIEPLVGERPKLRSDLSKFAEYAKFKLVQILEERLKKEGKSLAPIAKAYEEFQAEFPGSENADKALYNASVAWDLVGEREHADKLRQILMQEYKDSPLRVDVQFYTAKTHEERAEYMKAAELFEAFAAQYPTDERARDAMFNAAVFYAGTGKVQTATKLREEYLKKYGRAKGGEKEAAAIYFAIAQDLERNKKWSLAAQRYEEFSKKFPGDDQVFEALWREASIRADHLRQGRQAEKVLGILLGEYLKRKKKGLTMPPAAVDYASRIELENTHQVLPKYHKMSIRRPNLKKVKEFQGDMASMARVRDDVVKAYTRIVTEYQQAHSTIGALLKIAEAWDFFAKRLAAVPCPSGLTSEQCDLFREGFEREIDPPRQAALQGFRACVAKSSELSVFTRDSATCVKRLEELSPDDFPELVERTVPFTPPQAKLKISPQPLILKPSGAVSPGSRSASRDGAGEPGGPS